MSETRLINVTDLIDTHKLSRLQIITIVLCALVNTLDGMDTQSIGMAAPMIATTLGMKMSSFGPIFSAAMFGAMCGALTVGPFADRLGRRRMLAFTAFVFGIFTLLTAHAATYDQLLAFRFIAGLGLGGATPCFITLTSEYAPQRLRGTIVTMMWACFPGGGMLGGFLNSWILTDFGWRVVFWVGGSLPLLVGVLVLVLAPESLRFLMARAAPQARIAAIVARMFPDVPIDGARFVAREQQLGGVTVRHLFTEGRAISTLLLWGPFFLGFGTLAVSVFWTPTLLHMSGITPGQAAFVIGIYGMGGLIGNAIAGRLLDRFGILAVPVPGFLLGAAAIAGLGHSASSVLLASFCGFFTSFMIGLGLASAIALASAYYPTAVRSTGMGWAMGVGRSGQVLGPLLAGATLGWGWNASEILTMMGAFPVIAAIFMLALHRRLTNQPPVQLAAAST